jgi:hypothetical protein
MVKHQFWQNSKCVGSYLHRWTIIKEFPEGVLENCEICHKSKFFKVVGGQVEGNVYMSWHLRLALGNIPIPTYIWHEYQYIPLSNEIVSPYL